MAPPEIELTDKQLVAIEVLAATGASHEAIAEYVDISVDTLTRRYADLLKKGKNKLLCNLRMKQFQKAMEGNVTMLVWLGKNLLGQGDNFNVTVNNPKAGFQFKLPDNKKTVDLN